MLESLWGSRFRQEEVQLPPRGPHSPPGSPLPLSPPTPACPFSHDQPPPRTPIPTDMPLSSTPAAPQAQGSPPTVWQLRPLPPTRLLGPSPTSRTVPLPEGALLRDRNQDDSQMTPVCPRPLLRERDSFTEWESQEAHPVGRATAVPGSHHLHDTVRQLLTAARSPSGSIPVSPLLSSARGTFDHGSRKGRDARPGPQLPARSRQRWGQTRPP